MSDIGIFVLERLLCSSIDLLSCAGNAPKQLFPFTLSVHLPGTCYSYSRFAPDGDDVQVHAATPR